MSNPDDLDDGLDYNYGLESNVLAETIDSDTEEPESKKRHEGDTEVQQGKSGNPEVEKRKPDETHDIEEEHLSKRQKKLKNSKLKEKKQEQSRYEVEQKKKIPKSSPDEIVQYFATLIRQKNPDMSALELDELYFKKSDFLSTEKFEEDRSLTNFVHFASQFPKSPKVLVVSLTNLRVADVFRTLGGSKSSVKLFSKNKLNDDLNTLEQILGAKSKKNGSIKFLIATPTRLEKLMESTDMFFQGKEKLDILLDASFLDLKENTLLNCDNTTVLCRVLRTFLNKKSSVKILLY